MARNVHEVTNFLFTDPSKAVLPKDKQITELVPGQVGIFSSLTNLSIDGTDTSKARDFYLAVGIGDSQGNLADVKKSSGWKVQRGNVQYYTARCYTPGQNQVWEITDLNPECEKDFVLKLQFNIPEQYFNYGFTSAEKLFSAVTGCCDHCSTGCGTGDCRELAIALAKNINLDDEKLVTARLFPVGSATTPPTAINNSTEIDPADDAAIAAWLAANPANADGEFPCLGIRIYGNSKKINDYCNIPNVVDNFPLGVAFEPVLRHGFNCMGKTTKVQELIYDETPGVQLKYEEFYNAGYSEGILGGIYRLTESGIPLGGENRQAKVGTGYTVISLSYDQMEKNGWLSNTNQQCSVIAIPCTGTIDPAVGYGFVKVLDLLLAESNRNFDGLFDDLASCTACNVVNKTTDKPFNQDGIG